MAGDAGEVAEINAALAFETIRVAVIGLGYVGLPLQHYY